MTWLTALSLLMNVIHPSPAQHYHKPCKSDVAIVTCRIDKGCVTRYVCDRNKAHHVPKVTWRHS